MSLYLILPVLAVLVLLLALKLRGPSGRGDLTGPPRPKAFPPAEAARLAELIVRGEKEEEEAFRQMRKVGQDEASARKLIALVKRLGVEARKRER